MTYQEINLLNLEDMMSFISFSHLKLHPRSFLIHFVSSDMNLEEARSALILQSRRWGKILSYNSVNISLAAERIASN